MIEKRNPENLLDALHEKRNSYSVLPTKNVYRVGHTRMNIISELASTIPNKHVHGAGEYGHLFLSAGFPSFGSLYPYSSSFTTYNPVQRTLVTSTERNITNTAGVNTVCIAGGQARDRIILVDTNYSDVSNVAYGLGGVIVEADTNLSPLGLDFSWESPNREYWQDTDDDYRPYVPVVYFNFPQSASFSPLYTSGNDRPHLYDTRINMYSGAHFYKEAFGVKVFVKVYNKDITRKREYPHQSAVVDQNDSVLMYHELELIDSYAGLKDSETPKVGMLRYDSPSLKSRRFNPGATDTLTLRLGDYYTNGEVWDSLYGGKVKIGDLDIDVIVTVDERTSRLQPEVIGATKDAQLSGAFNTEKIDYLQKQNIDQYTVFQQFDPSSFAYFAKKGSSVFGVPTSDDLPVGANDFPLTGSTLISDVYPKHIPNGVSANKKTAMSYTQLRLDTSNATASIIPPPFIYSHQITHWVYCSAEEDDASNFEFRISVDRGPSKLSDGRRYGSEEHCILAPALQSEMFVLFGSRSPLIERSSDYYTSGGVTGTNLLHRAPSRFFTVHNPFVASPTDDFWFPTPKEMAQILHGESLSHWEDGVLSPYDASNDYYFKDSGSGAHDYHNANDVLHWAYKMGLWSHFPDSGSDGWGDCLNNQYASFNIDTSKYQDDATNLTRYYYKDYLWIPSVYTVYNPSSPTLTKQYHHLKGPAWNRVFNQRTDGESTLERLTFSIRNTHQEDSGAVYTDDTHEISDTVLPIEDILYIYWNESSNVYSMEYDEDNDMFKIHIKFGQGGCGWETGGTPVTPRASYGTGGNVDPTNIVNFCSNVEASNLILHHSPMSGIPVYMKSDIKVLPDIKKIVFEENQQDSRVIVEDFIRGNWTISQNGYSVSARPVMAEVFGVAEATLANLEIDELFNPNSFFYGFSRATGYYNNSGFSWYFLLWQLYLYTYYKSSIWSNLSDFYRLLEGHGEVTDEDYGYYFHKNSTAYSSSQAQDLIDDVNSLGDAKRLVFRTLHSLALFFARHSEWTGNW